jgi:hypothetical protein
MYNVGKGGGLTAVSSVKFVFFETNRHGLAVIGFFNCDVIVT